MKSFINFLCPKVVTEKRQKSNKFFHGKFKIHIIEAKDLPDTDLFSVTDPFVTGDLGTANLFKTKCIKNDVNPHWNEHFEVYVCHNECNNLIINIR